MTDQPQRGKLSHLRKGVEAFRALALPLPPLYVCPLCVRGTTEEHIEELTYEHVPPKSLGGQRLVLTCRECNNRAGGKVGVDTHARHGEDWLDLVTRTLNGERRARFAVGATAMNVRIRAEKNYVDMVGMPGPPGEVDSVMDAFLRMARMPPSERPSLSITLSHGRYTRGRQEVSWLRAAYLAAFAAFGYRYILRELLQPVRKQIENPDAELIDDFHMWHPAKEPRERSIVLVTEPDWVQGMAVIMSRHLVLLPLFDGDVDFYQRMGRFGDGNGKQVIVGFTVPWPRTPRFELDFDHEGDLMNRIWSLKKETAIEENACAPEDPEQGHKGLQGRQGR